jgi:hypothetical protein
MIFFDIRYLNAEAVIRSAIDSNVYLGGLSDSLYDAVLDVSIEGTTTLDVAIKKYEAFFKVLRNELKERGIEKVLIGEATDVTSLQREGTLEMTPNGIFICENEKTEEPSKLQNIQNIIKGISSQDVVARVVHAIKEQQYKSLIDSLESDVKYIKDLVENKCSTVEESEMSIGDRSEGRRKRKSKDERLP